jgi:hypothetical protein
MKLLTLALVLAAGCIIPPPGGGAGSSTMPSSGGPPPSGSYQAQPAAAGGPTSSAPAAPAQVSVDLHNDCPNEVKLFLGEKPKWGSGTYTSLGSNTTTSYSMKPGDMIWIVDEGQNGISSMSAGTGTFQNMKITQSCSGFAPN